MGEDVALGQLWSTESFRPTQQNTSRAVLFSYPEGVLGASELEFHPFMYVFKFFLPLAVCQIFNVALWPKCLETLRQNLVNPSGYFSKIMQVESQVNKCAKCVLPAIMSVNAIQISDTALWNNGNLPLLFWLPVLLTSGFCDIN